VRTVKVTVKGAVIGREIYSLLMLNQAFGPAPIFDNLGNSTGLQPVGFLIASQISDASHGSVLVHDLAEYSGCWEVGHAGEIDCGFRVPGTAEHSVINGLQGKDVTGLHEAVRGGLLIGQQAYSE
tara:strand:+ start:167 stop:541 length:375 start_codon:yes stop_codon:yes gene_type:complete